MPTTTNYGFYTPPLTGVTPNVPRDTKTLADAIDVALKAEETARLAADAVVMSRRTNTAGTSFTHNVTTVVPFATVEQNGIPWDGTNNRFTVPTTAVYQINTALIWAAHASGLRAIRINVNGTTVSMKQTEGSSVGATSIGIADALFLTAGDLVSISASQSSGGALALSAVAVYNFVSIVRIG